MIRRSQLVALVCSVTAGVGWSPAPAAAATRLYTIAIGNNAAPDSNQDEPRSSLKYADDDAAAIFALARPLSARAELLAVLDADSQRRFPDLTASARPPSFEELQRVVAETRADMQADLLRGDRPVLLFFYSGHGVRSGGDRPATLSLIDSGLDQHRLYEDVLARLPAHAMHLLIDACYAADVVRPRNAQAKVVDASEGDIARLLEANTLARFPQVGAVVAASVTGETHEWDAYRQGVFTHELLSGLRGAADVNVDGAIEYSELVAFLTSANRDVADPRARLHVVARPPAIDQHFPIFQVGSASAGPALLRSRQGTIGYFYVEDQRGNRLVEMRPEHGFCFHLHVPAGETLYLVSAEGTAELRADEGATIAVEDLTFQPSALRVRGAMTAAMRRGLFAETFGPSYYRGYVDSSPELVSVQFGARQVPDLAVPALPPRLLTPPVMAAAGAAGVLAATSLWFAIRAVHARDDFEWTTFEREAMDASARYTRDRAIAGIAAAGALVATATATWLIWHRQARRTDAAPSALARQNPSVVRW